MEPTPVGSSTFTTTAHRHPDQTTEQMTKKGKEGRIKFEHSGRTIYEWEQSLSEVNIYLEPPPEIPAKMFEIVISHKHLKVGIKGAPPFIDEDTGGPIIPDDSLWTLTDGELNINLQKMNKAEAWDCALMGQSGNSIDAFTKEETKKKLMLERFQEEVRYLPYSLCAPCIFSQMNELLFLATAPRVRLLGRRIQRTSSGCAQFHGRSEALLSENSLTMKVNNELNYYSI